MRTAIFFGLFMSARKMVPAYEPKVAMQFLLLDTLFAPLALYALHRKRLKYINFIYILLLRIDLIAKTLRCSHRLIYILSCSPFFALSLTQMFLQLYSAT